LSFPLKNYLEAFENDLI